MLQNSLRARRYASRALTAAVFTAILSGAGLADTTATYSGPANGSWNNVANWANNPTGAFIPNNGNGGVNYQVIIDNATITTDGNFTIDGLQINLNDALDIDNNTTLGIVGGGTIANNGVLQLTATGNNTQLSLVGGTASISTITLTGSGKVEMGDNPNNGIVANASGLTLINTSAQTIIGAGYIGNGVNSAFTLVNQGTITANSTNNALIVSPQNGVINTGLLQAGDGTVAGAGVLNLASDTYNNTGGQIAANAGSIVQLLNGTYLYGGTLTTYGSGSIQTAYNNFNPQITGNITLSTGSNLNVVSYSELDFAGGATFTNNGTVSLLATGNSARIGLVGGGTVTLAGSGRIVMGDNPNNGIIANASGLTLINTSAQTIIGAGYIGNGVNSAFTLVNQGTITANSTNNALIVSPRAGVVNTGILQAGDGTMAGAGVLNLASDTYNNIGGQIVANVGSIVQLLNGTYLYGGTLTTYGSGSIQTAYNNFAALLSGPLTITSGTVFNVPDYSAINLAAGTTITNNGLISLNSAGGNRSDVVISGVGTVTLAGTGSISLSTVNSNRIVAAGTGSVLDNTATHSIVGMGVLDSAVAAYTLKNEGVITALGAAPLFINPGAGVTNTGTLQAGNGTTSGVLQLQGDIFTNAGGTILANAGSTVQILNGADIVGGTLTSSGIGSSIATVYGNFSAELTGPLTLSAGTVLNVSNYSALNLVAGSTYFNNGTISLNAGGNQSEVVLNGAGTVTLAGSGSINMATGGDNLIYAATVGTYLLNSSTHTIFGMGTLSSTGYPYTVLNAGTITALGASPLLVNPGAGVVNTNILQAGNGTTAGTLELASDTYTNTNGVIQANADSTVYLLNGINVIGGTLTASGTGASFTTLAGNFTPVLTGSMTITSGTLLNIANYSALNLVAGSTYSNNGTISLNAGGNQSEIVLNGAGTVTLAGSGSINMATGGDNLIYAATVGTYLLNSSTHTIFGMGTLSNTGYPYTVVNAGTITALGASPLTVHPGAGVINTNIMQAGNGAIPGTLQLANDTYTNTNALIQANADSTVILFNGADIYGGTLAASGTGASFTTVYGNFSAELIGPTTIATNTLVTVPNYSALSLAGGATYTNNGTIALNAGGNQSYFQTLGSGTVTLAGSGTLSLATSNTNNEIIAGTTGSTLDNTSKHTIVGSGQFSGAASQNYALRNEGTITALGTLIVNPGAGVVNSNLIQAGNGVTPGVLQLQNDNYSNNGVIQANAGSTVILYNGANIYGGTLTASGTGASFTTVYGNFSAELFGPTIITANTLVTVPNYSALSLAGGATYTNNGTIALNAGGNQSYFQTLGAGTVTLAGSGTLSLATANTNNEIITGSTGSTLDNTATQTIVGAGQFSAAGQNFTLRNEGTITALGTLIVNPGAGVVNSNLIQAGNGVTPGVLQLQNDNYSNNGVIQANAGSTVILLNGANIYGGTLTANGTGASFTTVYGNFLAELIGPTTISSNTLVTVPNYSALSLAAGATYTNNGTIALNAGGNQSYFETLGAGTVTLAGSGTLSLATANNNNLIVAGSTGSTLDNSAGHTIAGSGQFSGAASENFTLRNEGVIMANLAGTTLLVAPGISTSNTGVFRATNNATLNVTGLFVQDTAGTLTAGTYIVDENSALSLTSSPNITTIGAAATVILTGTASSFVQIDNPIATSGFVATNLGTFELLGNRSYNLTSSGFSNAGTLQLGGGTFTAPNFSNNASGLILGFGALGNGVLNSTGTVDAAGGTLTLSGTVSQLSGTTLTAGTWEVANNSALIFPAGSNVITTIGAATTVILTGAASSFPEVDNPLGATGFVAQNNGVFELLANRSYNLTSSGFTNAGTLQLGGGTFAAPSMTNNSLALVSGYGTLTPQLNNLGSVTASGGTLVFSNGLNGTSGTLQSVTGATLQIGSGGSAGALSLGNIINAGQVTFDQTGLTTVSGAITGAGTVTQLAAGTTTISHAASYTGPTIISAGTLDFSGGVSHSIGSVSGTGTLFVDANTTLTSDGVNLLNGTWIINGTQVIRSSAGGGAYGEHFLGQDATVLSGTSVTSNLTFGPDAKLDLRNNALIVQATPANLTSLLAQVAADVTHGYITSSTAAANPAYSLVVAVDNTNINAAKFGGVPVNSDSIIVTEALKGDANLDGYVDLNDFNIWLSNLGNPNSANSASTGDLNTDGFVDLNDFNLWLSNLGHNVGTSPAPSFASGGSLAGGGGLSAGGGAVATPEPASLVLLGLGALGLLSRRRSSRR